MGALLDRYRVAGISFAALPGGKLRAAGTITEPIPAAIREDKSAILEELAANDAATPEQAAELRWLIGVVAANWPADEQAEALAAALNDPADALTCYRALAAERDESTPSVTRRHGL